MTIPISTAELHTQVVNRPPMLNEEHDKKIRPPIPTEEFDIKETSTPIPTKEHHTEEIVPPIPTEKSETEEITPPVPTKELDTEEIVPPIPTEKSETEEITPPVPTKELDTEEIVPPIPTEKSETEEITPPVPTKELDTEEIVPPIPTEKSETEAITPPVPTKELDTEEIVPPIPTEKSETEEITPPVPTKELDTEEIVPPIPTEKSETEEITPPVPTKELDTEEIVPPIPTEKSETEEITPPVPTKELDTEEIVPPIPTEKSETEEITPPVPTKELDTEEIVPPIPTEKSETEAITPPVPTKELDTEEIVPPIPTEKSETEEITPPVPTKELDTEEIVPPIPTEKSETEEITPPVPTKELDTEEIVPPIPTEKSETEEITPPVPTKELDTEEIVPPIPTEKSETEEITPPVPTKELDTEEIVPPIPTEKSETEEITPPVPTKELDTEEIVPPIPTEKSETEEITPPVPTKELDTEEIVPPIPTEKSETEEITPSISTQELNFEKSTPLIPTKELDTKEITPPILTEELGREEIVSPISSEKSETEEITPPVPTKELDTEEIVPPIPTEKSETEEITPPVPTKELDTEEIVPPIPTEKSETEEITPSISTQELNFEKSTPIIPTKELDTKEITPPILTEELGREEIVSPISSEKSDTEEITPPIPTKELYTEEIVPHILTGKADTDEIRLSICTQELNFEDNTPLIPTKELDTKEITPPIPKVELDREEIPPMTTEELHAEGITPPIPTQDLDSEEIIPSIPTQEFVTKEIRPRVHTKELNTENMTADETHEDANLSKSDQILKELDSIDEIHEFVDCLTDTNQALLEPVEQLQVEDHIPVVNQLQSLRDVQEDMTRLQENVTAETIIDELEQETVAVQDFLPAVIIHLEEKEVKVTSENLPGGFKEDQKPTTEILSEASLDSVDVSEAQTDAFPSEECSVQLAEDKILSEEVVSELKEATELLREVSVEPENKAVAKEPVDESEDELIQEIEAVQATQFESAKAEGVLVEKLNEETVLLPEIEDKTMAAPEIEFVQDPQALVLAQERPFGSVTVDVQYADLKEHIDEEEPPMEEVKEENVPLLQTNVEPEEKEQKSVSDSQIEHIKEEEDTRVEDMSVKAEEISKGITTEETMIAEFKDRPVPLTDHEPISKDQKAKAELSPEQEVVQKSCLKSEQRKEIGEGTHPRGTMKEECEEETVTQLQTNIESAKDDKVELHVSEIELVKEIEGTHPTQSIQTQSVDAEQTIVAEEKMTELKEETVRLTLVQPESGLKVVDAAKTEPNPEQAVVEEDEAITDDIAKERTVSVALKEEAVPLSEINVEPEDKDEEAVNETENIKAVKSEAFASEEANEVIHRSEETTEGILVKVITPGELKEEAEPLPEVTPGNEGKKQLTGLTEDNILPEKTTEDAQNETTKSSPETEALQSISDLVQELEEDTVVATETVEVAISRLGITEKRITRTLPKEALAEDIPKPETENEITSEGEETKPQLDQALDKEEDPEPENTADDLPQVMEEEEEEDGTPQVTEADVSSQQGETRCAQILEKVIYEEIPEFEVEPSDIKTRIEGENCDRSDVEVTTATAEHAVVTQVTMCDLKEVSTSPPALIATPSAIREPLQGSVATESTETAVNEALLMTDVAEMAKMGNEVMMMHVPATVIEDNHSIQVQVVHVDITLAERSVDQRLQVEIREKGVIDVCNASVERVEHVSASMGVEHVIHEDNTVIRHAVVPHVRETQPETFEQVVLIEAKEVELGKDDGNMEIPDKELAHKRENLAEASQREADTRSLEVPVRQESLEETIGDLGKSEVTEDRRQTISPHTVPQNISVESMSESEWEKEDGNWALEAEKPMATTDGVQAPVVEEEPSSQTDSHEDTEPARKGPQTTVVEEPLPKREAVASQKEKDLTEEGVQSREPLSQTTLNESQNAEPTEESPQTPTAEETRSQTVTQGPLSQLDPLDDLKTTQQSEVSVQALEKEKHISQIDKDDNLTKVSVLTPETKEHLPMLDTVVRHATLIKEGLQMLVAEEILLELPPVVSYKETVAAEVGILELDSVDLVHHKQTGISRQSVQAQETEESFCPKEPVESQTQAVQIKESHQAPKAEESISQKESTESQKQMAIPEEHDLPHKDSTETQKRTEPPEEHFQLKKESSQTQKQTERQQKHVQARKIQESLAQKESTETQKQVPEKHVQAREDQESLAQKETERTESSVQAPETENSPFPEESAEGQKQTVRIKETSEPARELDSMEITVATEPPVLLDSGLQEAAEEILPVLAVEKLQPVETGEKIASKANEIPNIRGTDRFQTVQKPESEALVKEADDKQDIWVDAREDLDFQEETDHLPSQDENSRHDCKPETKTAHEEESEMVPIPEPEAESNNEDEDFAVALDDPKTESAAVIEWD
ncbi:titin-like [Phycodurus eques]|uniref:titin-like n=1 Tax=Phycodurus eques TaxID=693459 RepID=UPI002ACDCF4E|nr:titin-like [Phycodurus eques]